MSDRGSRWNDLPFWALKLRSLLTIEATGPQPHLEIAPASMHAIYEYGARGELPPVRMHWYQGEEKPELWKNDTIPRWDSGVLFLGKNGMLLASYNKNVLLPEKNFRDFVPPHAVHRQVARPSC
jgi:hypothetical protein